MWNRGGFKRNLSTQDNGISDPLGFGHVATNSLWELGCCAASSEKHCFTSLLRIDFICQ